MIASLRLASETLGQPGPRQPEAAGQSEPPNVILAACQIMESIKSTRSVKLSVLMRGESLAQLGAIGKACARLKPEQYSDNLQASHRCDKICTSNHLIWQPDFVYVE
jgi:hypothetical protein